MGYSNVHYHRNFKNKPSRLETVSRNLLVGLNTIFVVFGFVLIVYGIGGKTSTNRNAYVEITENGGDLFQYTSNVLIILGMISLCLGLYALSGIHDYCKAFLYISLLLLLIFTDLFWSFYSTQMETNAKISVENNLIRSLESLRNSQIEPNSTLMTTRLNWEALQSELKCCGVYDYRDWYLPANKLRHVVSENVADSEPEVEDTLAHTSSNMTEQESPVKTGIPAVAAKHYASSEDFFRIPKSCFKNGDDGMRDVDYNDPVSPEFILDNVFSEGCLDKTVVDIDIVRMQRVGLLMACFKIFAVLFALIVTCHLKNDKVVFDYV